MNENDAVVLEILKFAFVTPTHADRHSQNICRSGVSNMTGQGRQELGCGSAGPKHSTEKVFEMGGLFALPVKQCIEAGNK